MNPDKVCEDLQEKLNYRFVKPALLKQALTHSSYANEQKSPDYERLEFVGDAVLELTVSDHLYHTMEDMREGDMTKLRASLVCEPTLSFCAREIELDRYILLGKGEEQTGGRNRDSIISDVFEAVIGALYLDGGISAAKSFVEQYVLKDMYNKIEFVDSKSKLQEYTQERGIDLRYELLSESCPAH
ncbi:MAG: ribonuclease III, partial [Lachnospiraceae bacterium]|nr:ribonuclease III [Lachnospiraceae bacterium]